MTINRGYSLQVNRWKTKTQSLSNTDMLYLCMLPRILSKQLIDETMRVYIYIHFAEVYLIYDDE